MTISRLLMFAERYPPDLGGVARSASRIARSPCQVPCDAHVVAWTKSLAPGQLVTDRRDGEPTVHRIGLFGNLDMSLQHTMNVLDWLHEQHNYDAIWGHYLYPAGFMSVVSGEKFRLPSIVSARGNDVDRMMFPPGDFARLQWTLQRATLVSSVSCELADKIRLISGDDRRISILRNVVDTGIFQPKEPAAALREALNIAPNEAVLGFCGELRHKKGLPFLVQALAHVRRTRPACLLVIGEVRARDQSQLSAIMADLPDCGRRIRITGVLQDPRDVAEHLNLCDVFLQPSVWDGMPNAVLEAMACERIVIGSDAGGIPEIIDHQKNGFLIPRSQLHRLGEAVIEVLRLSREEQRRLGQRARDRMLADFRLEQEVGTLRELLAKAAEQRPAS